MQLLSSGHITKGLSPNHYEIYNLLYFNLPYNFLHSFLPECLRFTIWQISTDGKWFDGITRKGVIRKENNEAQGGEKGHIELERKNKRKKVYTAEWNSNPPYNAPAPPSSLFFWIWAHKPGGWDTLFPQLFKAGMVLLRLNFVLTKAQDLMFDFSNNLKDTLFPISDKAKPCSYQ